MTSTTKKTEPSFLLRPKLELFDRIKSAYEQSGSASQNSFLLHCVESALDAGLPLGDPTKLRGHLASVIGERISNILTNNEDWFTEVVHAVQHFREGQWVFGDRLDHYLHEKRAIATRAARLILERCLWLLKDPKASVTLVVDSGTTLYWFFLEFENQLVQAIPRHPELKNLSILTNNISGLDTYMTACRTKTIGEKKNSKRLDDYVHCHSVGGRVFQRYSALIGPTSVQDLGKARAQNKQSTFIGLVVGSWVLMSAKSPHPVLLTKEPEQVEFKSKLITISDEIYALTPLGKIFMNKSLADVNGELKANPKYARVVHPLKASRTKLISTLRADKNTHLLYEQSEALKTLRPNHELIHTAKIEEMGDCLFDFDPMQGAGGKSQEEIECPHEVTRQVMFRKNMYGSTK